MVAFDLNNLDMEFGSYDNDRVKELAMESPSTLADEDGITWIPNSSDDSWQLEISEIGVD